MTYVKGQLIAAADYNNFIGTLGTTGYASQAAIDAASPNVGSVYGVGFGDRGYGQTTVTLATVSAGDDIAAEWADMQTALQACLQHQTGSIPSDLPVAADVASGAVVFAHEADAPSSNPKDFDSNIATANTNRLVQDAGSSTALLNQLSSTRTASWVAAIQHIFQVTFASADDARFFFNSGSEIRLRGSRAGGSGTAQNADWTALLSSQGNICFGSNDTTTSGSATVAAIGYYDLTGSFQQISTISGAGAYANNDAIISARTVDGNIGSFGDNGKVLEFKVNYNDPHTNPFTDSIDGTIVSAVDILIATTFLTITAISSFVTSTELTAGS